MASDFPWKDAPDVIACNLAFGDLVNDLPRRLTVEGRVHAETLLASIGAVAGLNASELPKLENMFKHVSQTLGGELEGFPSLSEHRPQAPARELLQQFWPLAVMCFNGELSGAVAKSGAVRQRWRPIIAAYAANTFIRKVQSVLGPAAAIVIVMETAIYTSKLDPAVIEKP